MKNNWIALGLLLAAAPWSASAAARLPVLVKPGDKIVTFGDSISSGKGYGWMAVDLMNKERPDLKLTRASEGYPGWKASDAVNVIDKVLADKPTLVTIMFGTNDIGNRGARGVAEIADNLRKLVDPLKKAGIRVVLLTTPFANPDQWLPAEWDRAGLPAMGERIFALGKEEGVPVFDMFAFMKAADAAGKKKDPKFDLFSSDGVHSDGVHPSPETHALMARGLADFLLGKSVPGHVKFEWHYSGEPQGVAVKAAAPVNINPLDDAFPVTAKPMTLDKMEQISDPTRWKGPADLSAKARAAWDQQNLYFSFDVTDDVVMPAPQQPGWDYDGIEIFLDTRPRARRDVAWGPGYVQLLAATALANGPASVVCGSLDTIDLAGVTANYRRTGTGYTIDIAIPWTALHFAPHSGDDIGFDFAINDRDDPRFGRYKALWRGGGDDFTNAGSLGLLKLE